MFGLRAWPTPLAKPLWPFAIASVLTWVGVAKLQAVALDTPDARTNPKNPYITSQAKAEGHH